MPAKVELSAAVEEHQLAWLNDAMTPYQLPDVGKALRCVLVYVQQEAAAELVFGQVRRRPRARTGPHGTAIRQAIPHCSHLQRGSLTLVLHPQTQLCILRRVEPCSASPLSSHGRHTGSWGFLLPCALTASAPCTTVQPRMYTAPPPTPA